MNDLAKKALSVNVITATPDCFLAWLYENGFSLRVHMADRPRLKTLGYDLGDSLVLASECTKVFDDTMVNGGFSSPSARTFFKNFHVLSRAPEKKGMLMIVTACRQHIPRVQSTKSSKVSNAEQAKILKYGQACNCQEECERDCEEPLCPNAIVVVAMASKAYVLVTEEEAERYSIGASATLVDAAERWGGFYMFKKNSTRSVLNAVKDWLSAEESKDTDALRAPVILMGYLGNLRGMSAYWGAQGRVVSHLYVALTPASLACDVRQALSRGLGYRTVAARQANGFDKVRF